MSTLDTPSFDGRLFLPEDEGFDEACVARVFNGRLPGRRAAAVLQAASERDVVEGVRLARARSWSVSVRAGGHSFPVWSLRDDALLIDLGAFREMAYEPETGIATATPAVEGGRELNPMLAQHGRFFPTGGCPTVGLGGFLLQGGLGWNFRGWGFACEQVVAVDVVTADGELVHADATANADLWWAARGAGPGLSGIVTRFHLNTRPLPGGLASAMQVLPIDRAEAAVEWLCTANATISDRVHLVGVSLVPPFEVPGHDGGLAFVIWGAAFCDTLDESAQALGPITDNPFTADALAAIPAHPTTLEAEHAFVDSGHPSGLRYRVDSSWVEGSPGEVVERSRKLMRDRPAGDRGYTFFWFTRKREAPDMAASLMTDVMVGAYMIYEDADDDETFRAWSLEAMAELDPITVGQYWGDSDQGHREVKCFTDEAWRRLEELRASRDPDGVFVDYLATGSRFRNRNGWPATPILEKGTT